MADPRYLEILERLLRATGASRTTLRLDTEGRGFGVAAEALAPGVPSIARDAGIDVRGSATFRYLERERRFLVQGDLLTDALAPPPELLSLYGARAQMLAPVLAGGELRGVVSVHHGPEPREWSAEDVAALAEAVAEVVARVAAGRS